MVMYDPLASENSYGAQQTDYPGLTFDPGTGRYIVAATGNIATQADIDAAQQAAYEQAARLRGIPTNSFSSSTSQSFQDPRALALQEKQFEAQLSQVGQEYQQWLKEFELSKQQGDARIAADKSQLAFLQTKHADEMSRGDTAQALDTIRLMEQIDARHAQDEFQQQTLLQQARVTNASFQMQASQINEQMRVANLQQRQSVARDISEFTRSPGDVGAAAGFLRAGGVSPLSTAIGKGESAITPQSLAILNNMLAVSDEVMKNPNYITAPEVDAAQFSQRTPLDVLSLLDQLQPKKGVAGSPAQFGSDQITWDFGQESPLGDFTPETAATGYAGMQENAMAGLPTAYDPNGDNWRLDTDAQQWVKMENGGILSGGAAIVGDSSDGRPNEELVIGDATVIPLDKFTPEQQKRIRALADKRQTGGAIGNPLLRAQSFLDDAGRLAMQMGGFSKVPTPISMATPGQSPWLASLGAAVASTTRGIPKELFFDELQRLTPQGINDNAVRRTR